MDIAAIGCGICLALGESDLSMHASTESSPSHANTRVPDWGEYEEDEDKTHGGHIMRGVLQSLL
jgi:hypothetical protein